MQLSRLFGRTLRQSPTVADPWTALALRASIVRLLDDRVALLPLGERVLARLAESLRSIWPMAQAVVLPFGSPKEHWPQFLQGVIQSYRQLPVTLYTQRNLHSFTTPQGLAHPPYFTAFQWVVATTSKDELQDYRERWRESVGAWWSSIYLAPQRLEWLPKMLGWAFIHEAGPDELLTCCGCGYLATLDAARFERPSAQGEALEEVAPVPTPGADTIRDLAEMLSIPESRTLKAVFMTTNDDRLVFTVLRGDYEISLSKLVNIVGCQSLRPAQEAEIRECGAEPGYASPIGLEVGEGKFAERVLIIGDLSIEHGSNFVAGANKPGFHLMGVNFPRDFSVSLLADIATARAGDSCPECGKTLVDKHGICLGGWQKFAASIRYTSEDGVDEEGFVGLGTLLFEPILAAVLAVHNDDKGVVWPMRLAPYDVHLVELRCPEEAAVVVQELEKTGLSILHDDRKVSPGVKFADADLIGCPLRVTVSRRSLENGGVELSMRNEEQCEIIPISELCVVIQTRFCIIM